MAGQTQGNGDDEPITGINVTPLVDVALVLLIIFIVTASSMLRTTVPMKLPKSQTAEQSTAGLLTIAVTKKGEIFINAKPATVDGIGAAVAEARGRLKPGDPALTAFVSADVGAQYGQFAEVVDRLRLEGVYDIAMDTQPVDLEAQTK